MMIDLAGWALLFLVSGIYVKFENINQRRAEQDPDW